MTLRPRAICLLLAFILAALGCERLLVKSELKLDPKSIFMEYAGLVKEKYAMLASKNIDIDHLSDSIAATITGGETEVELFRKLSAMTQKLKDGHCVLESKDFRFVYQYYMQRDITKTFNQNALVNRYWKGLKSLKYNESVILYGTLPDDSEIGYLFISSFNFRFPKNQLEAIFESLSPAKALILDVRGNTGGNTGTVSGLAGYFTDKQVFVGKEYFKIGPGADDFSESNIYNVPSGSRYTYLKPVYLLMNRECFSAASTLIYMLGPLEHVTTVGDTSGGGSGFPFGGFLSNGWRWQLSVSEFKDYKNRSVDGGIDPDIFQALDPERNPRNRFRDALIERAVGEFRELNPRPRQNQ